LLPKTPKPRFNLVLITALVAIGERSVAPLVLRT